MNENITLYYREGSADKIYQARLEEKSGGFVVNFAFGRRGTALQSGTKTKEPVPYAKAKDIYAKLINEKQGKGYTPGEDGVRFQSTPSEERSTGIIPQLLNAVDENTLETLLLNHRYALQEKFDGKRIMIRLANGSVEGINRKGLVVALPEPIAKAVSACGLTSILIDGELLGDRFVAFDLLETSGQDHRGFPYRIRLILLDRQRFYGNDIQLAQTAVHPVDKRAMRDNLLAQGKEGVVIKDLEAPYAPGRPNSGGPQLKHKFYDTASFVVREHNDQRSVVLGLYRDDDNQFVSAGNVTIPPNAAIPDVGQIVEVRYLYAFRESGVIYQPTFLGKRDDINPGTCTTAQLKFKAA